MDATDSEPARPRARPRRRVDVKRTALRRHAPAQRAENEPERRRVHRSAAASAQAINRVWTRLALSPSAPPTVSRPEDPEEREAERMADRVMRMRADETEDVRGGMDAQAVQRKCATCEEAGASCASCAGNETEGTGAEPTTSSGGRPLGRGVRAFFEPRLGVDLRHVRVHTDDEAARALHARAFTIGRNVVFAGGEFAPTSESGRHLLAHELTHVAQQGLAAPLGGGRGASARPESAGAVHRQAGDAPTAAPGDDAALTADLEQEIEAAYQGMNQDLDMGLRANAARRHLLLTKRSHSPLRTRTDLEALVAEVNRLSTTELDTLGVFSQAGAELAMAGYPKGFPLQWGGRVKAALTLGVDPKALLEEWIKSTNDLRKKAEALPPQLLAHGLPVPFGEVLALDTFRLKLSHAHAPRDSAVRDYARDAVRHMQSRFVTAFAFTWERVVDEIRKAVDEGRVVVSYHGWKDFVENKQTRLRELPTRARNLLAQTEQEAEKLRTDALQFGQDAIALGDAALLAGMMGGLATLFSVLGGWQDAQQWFDAAVLRADATIGGLTTGDRFLSALRWAWDNDYFSGAAAAWAENLIANGPEILGEIALILILGSIPFVNIAVAVYLAFTAARDVLGLLEELVTAIQAVTDARTVVEMQKASARLAQILTTGAITIVIVLATWGIGKGVAKIRKRVSQLKATEGLSEEAATKRALHEMSAEERAILEEGPAKVAKKFKEFGEVCGIGSIRCRTKIPDHIIAEAGVYPSKHGVPMPGGPFNVEKAALSGASRSTEFLRDICRKNRSRWPEFDKALAKAEKKGLDWPVERVGGKDVPWEPHHVKPVFMGGDSVLDNLHPLPKAIHQEFTNWWNRIHRSFRDRFTEKEWDQIYWSKKNVPGSRVPIQTVR